LAHLSRVGRAGAGQLVAEPTETVAGDLLEGGDLPRSELLAPGLERGRVDALTDLLALLVVRRVDSVGDLLRFAHRRIELLSEELADAADLLLRIGDEVLVAQLGEPVRSEPCPGGAAAVDGHHPRGHARDRLVAEPRRPL